MIKLKLFIEGKCRMVLPVTKGSNNGSCKLPLHIKMGWDWTTQDMYVMYNIKFEGHLFGAMKPIFVMAVGYLYGPHGHSYDGITHITDAVKLSTYKSSDGKLVFKLEGTSDWHASCLNMTLFDGEISYHKTAMKTIKIVDICHSADNL